MAMLFEVASKSSQTPSFLVRGVCSEYGNGVVC